MKKLKVLYNKIPKGQIRWPTFLLLMCMLVLTEKTSIFPKSIMFWILVFSCPKMTLITIFTRMTLVLHGIAWYCILLNSIAWYCMVLHGIAWYCMILHGIALYCFVLHGMYARVCQSIPEYTRVCQSMPGYARVCQSMPEYARVCQ